MKRTVKSILCLTLVLSMFLCLCACGGDGESNAAVGKYSVVSMEDGGMTLDKEMIEMILGEDAFYLELKADGTGVMSAMGEAAEMGWSGNKIWPADQKDEAVEFVLSGKTLTLEIEGAKIVFEKN